MTLIRKIAFTLACSGLVVAPTMANARSTSGGVPAFSVSAQAPANVNVPEGTISDDGNYKFTNGKWHLLKNGKWILWLGAASIVIGGTIILATNSR